jgi:hypothetical protein
LSTVVVDARFEGPPGAANGGVVCGLLAQHLPAGRPVTVTLRRPVPLAVPLTVADDGAGGVALAADDGIPLALAHVDDEPVIGAVPDVDVEAARAAVADPALVAAHPFPRCFGCGPQRDRASAVALLPGPVGDGVLATSWTPGPGLPQDREGVLAAPAVWAALDCPSGAAAVPAGAVPHVLGRLEGRVGAPIAVGEEVLVVAWPLGHEGRKRWGACALRSPDGEILGLARATWIALA